MKRQDSDRRKVSRSGSLLLATAGLIGGIFFWWVAGYLAKLFKQPALIQDVFTFDEDLDIEERGLIIAVANLLSGIEKRYLLNGEEKLVLCAGKRHFREPWARDLGFASLGLVEIGATLAAKESFEAFLSHQLPSGQFPVKLHSTGITQRYAHAIFKREQPIVAPLKPKYISGHNTISFDGQALLVVGILNYAESSGDHEFAQKHWQALSRALLWLEEHALEEDGLLHQGAFSDWADSVARTGRVLYTNVVYWKALQEMASAAEQYARSEDGEYFSAKASQLRESIQTHFWREDLGYFVTSQEFDNLGSSGNLLAIAWGLAMEEQAQVILSTMERFEMADPIPTKPVHPPYPDRYIAIENRLGRIGFYHTAAAWLWLGAWHIVALCYAGRLKEAEEYLLRITKVVARDGVVHEVYDPSGRFVSSFWYTSEAPLTWSAGMIVYAYDIYLRHRRKAGQFMEGGK